MWARLLGCVLVLIPMAAAAGEPSASGVRDHFEKKIRPLLADHCWRCHGAEKHKGGLRLDSAEGFARGGETGAVVAAGKPDESLLIEAVRYQNDLKMPPKAKLSEPDVAALVEWVRAGAVWPSASPVKAAVSNPSSPWAVRESSPFWAFQPSLDPTTPDVKAGSWAKSPLWIDSSFATWSRRGWHRRLSPGKRP